jgi:hypothetical protein
MPPYQTKKLDLLVNSRGLSSVMNQTKWRRLVEVMSALQHLSLPVRIKYVHKEEPSASAPFGGINWRQMDMNGWSGG